MKLLDTLRHFAFLCLMALFGCEKTVEKIGPALVLNGDPNFGEIWEGDKVTRTFVLRNNSDESAMGLTLQLPTGYISSKGTALGNLAAKDSLLFDVSFAPTASGLYNNDLIIKRTDNSTTVKGLTGKALGKIWDKSYGGNLDDYITCILATSDGGHLLGGWSRSELSGDRTQANKGDGDYWLVKINANGDKVWDKAYGGNQDERMQTIINTADGGYLLGGYSTSGISGDKTQASKGDWDYWIVKISANGDKQWDKTFGGDKTEDLRVVLPTSDGGYLLAGSSGSGVSGDRTQPLRTGGGIGSNHDYWAVKINGNGDKQWDKAFGGNRTDILTNMITTPDGGYLLGGWSPSEISGEKSQASQGGDDYWVVKINTNGDKQWDKTYGAAQRETLSGMVTTADGGYLLCGSSSSGISGDKTETLKGGFDAWVVKINATGDKQWDKTHGDSGYEEVMNVIPTGDGNFLLGTFKAVAGEYYYYMLKMMPTGQKIWDRAYGRGVEPKVVATADGGFLLGGGSSYGVIDQKTQASKGSADYWVVKVR
jgi:hypothetical protein